MTDEIEFLKNEVARLRTEQVIEDDPIRRLSLEKKIAEGVIAGVLVLVVAWVIAHYFGVTL